MTKREAYQWGRDNGLSAAENCEVAARDQDAAYCDCGKESTSLECNECLSYAAGDAEDNARQFADHLPYFGELQSHEEDALMDAYDAGVAAGIKAGVKARLAGRVSA